MLGKLGKYERVDVLGHGASGIVYLAWDTMLKKQVALKEIDLQAGEVDRFLEEARVMDRLRHPNIVRVNGVDRFDGHIVIDMEYVKGRNLQQVLREEGRLAVDRALHIAIQTLDALDYAHRMRTVHRDIKPANILLDRNDEVKLVDFGLAEILATNSYAGGAGTYAYMAPEDFSEEHHSDHQGDIWAVGVSLYEMLTAERPFVVTKAKDPFAWRKMLQTESPTPLSFHMETVPAGLQQIIDRALARDKRERYSTAGQFRDGLIELSMQLGMKAVSVVTAVAGPAWDLDSPRAHGSNGKNGHHVVEDAEHVVVAEPTLPLRPLDIAARVAEAAPPMLAPVAVPQDAQAQPKKRSLMPFGKKEIQPLRATLEPGYVHFGDVRKGDERKQVVRVRFEGGQGKVNGRVASGPAWVEVNPPTFHRRTQNLTVTALSDRVWQKGNYEDVIRLETDAGEVQIPVAIHVLKSRPRFYEVALWFVPLVFAVILPALTVAWGSQFHSAHGQSAQYLVPAAALGSALLASMLLIVASEADLGFGEKLACGVLMAVMAMVLGLTVRVASVSGKSEILGSLPATGVPIGLVLAVQLASRKRWQLWAGAIVVLALVTAGTFASTLASGR